MNVTVLGKNIQVTDGLRDMIVKKLSKLDKYFGDDIQAKATLVVQKNRQTVEVTIPFNGVILRCEESTEDMYKSIDLVEAKLERKIIKQRSRLQKRGKESLRFFEYDKVNAEDAAESEGKVVKIKKFNVKPMDEQEAILQMELIEHNFFVYRDAETNKINVIYKRNDGDYGLLEPEFI